MASWSVWRRPAKMPLSWKATGVRCSSSISVVKQVNSGSSSTVRPFNEMPGLWKNGVFNLYRLWKLDGFKNIHHLMEQNFKTFGPIYREKIGYYESVYIIKPEDGAVLFSVEGHYPKRLSVQSWTMYRDYRKRQYGVLLKDGQEWRTNRLVLNKEVISPKMMEKFVPLLEDVSEDFVTRVHKKIKGSGQNNWTSDFTQELFRFALESVSSVLYGERLGLLTDYVDPEAQRFIDCITLMFKSSIPMLYIPPSLLKKIGSKLWLQHVEAWDGIFNHADRVMQNIYRKGLETGDPQRYPGVLATLLRHDKLSAEDIKASVTELMTGGVDTTSITLLWTLYELAKRPNVQEELRAEAMAAQAECQGNMLQMLRQIPLIKAAVKETLRLHPVAVTVQRYIAKDIVIKNYHVPAGTLVQFGLYAMGRDPKVFPQPEQYMPSRWLKRDNNYFKSMSFGFGPRQCIGRRIAETEMQIFLIHILQNFRVEKQRHVESKSSFELIIIPDKPIILTFKPLDSGQ